VAMLKILEERFEAKGAGDAGFDFGELSGGEFFPARADGSVVAEAVEEELDFGKREAHLSREANQEDAVESAFAEIEADSGEDTPKPGDDSE